MTDNNHPITPTPELIEEWIELSRPRKDHSPNPNVLATYAARWGSDRELQLCFEWFQEFYKGETWVDKDLRAFMAARRPKPPMTKLSPAARAVFESFNSRFDWVEDGVPGPAIAAALHAAASQLLAVQWNGQIPVSATEQIGINWARDALHVLANELETQ